MQAPYGQQPDPNRNVRLLLGLIPEDVKKSASAAELNARLTEARRLGAQASDMRLDPLLRSQARMHAQQVLTAPRSAAPVQKAIANARADRLADEAAARAVVKGKAKRVAKAGRGSGEKTAMQAVFDQDGNLIGVVDPEQIAPVAGSGSGQDAAAPPPAQAPAPAAAAPAPAAAAGQVTKADAFLVGQVLKALGPKWMPVYQGGATPVGVVKRKHVSAAPAGRVAKGAAAADTAIVRDSRGRRLGEAPLSAITSVAAMRGRRRTVR